MLLHLRNVLNPEQLAEVRRVLAGAPWGDGRMTAGHQSAQVKHNQQVPEESPEGQQLGRLVVQALLRHAEFTSAVIPAQIFPPLFNRYGVGMGFGDHIDNAIRPYPGGRVRTDVSATLFLSDPGDYDGGELVVEDTYGPHSVKLPAGDLVVYPGTSVHRVLPVTRGTRVASFFWIQSVVRDDAQRTLLYDLDHSLGCLRQRGLQGEPEMVMLTGIYHNLLRRWAEL
jgi:PKHD-type hydroxylase